MSDAVRDIRAARAAVNDAIGRRDAEGIGAFLLPSYHVVTASGTQRSGREESIRSWSEMFARDDAATYLRLPDRIDVNDEWSVAQEHGNWKGRMTEGETLTEMAGVYAARWHLTADGWRLQAEIFTALSVFRAARRE